MLYYRKKMSLIYTKFSFKNNNNHNLIFRIIIVLFPWSIFPLSKTSQLSLPLLSNPHLKLPHILLILAFFLWKKIYIILKIGYIFFKKWGIFYQIFIEFNDIAINYPFNCKFFPIFKQNLTYIGFWFNFDSSP